MPRLEHGFYDPGEDAGTFDDPEAEDEENSRLPLLIVLALLVLAMFAGFVWLAYNEGVARGRSENPLIAAGTASKAAGSSSTPYKGFKIYEQPAPPDEEVNQTTPVPVQPVAAPLVVPETAVKAQTAKSVAAQQARPSQTQAAAKPAAPAISPLKAPVSSGYTLQIGAYKSEAEANSAWSVYKARHAAIVAGYSPDVVKADLGEKGTWYRLRITGFSGKDAASALCTRLKGDGGACFLGQ